MTQKLTQFDQAEQNISYTDRYSRLTIINPPNRNKNDYPCITTRHTAVTGYAFSQDRRLQDATSVCPDYNVNFIFGSDRTPYRQITPCSKTGCPYHSKNIAAAQASQAVIQAEKNYASAKQQLETAQRTFYGRVIFYIFVR